MRKEELQGILSQIRFIPESLIKLIYINIVTATDLGTITELHLTDMERTLDGQNKMKSCMLVLTYDSGKFVFKMKFKADTLQSFAWHM